MQVGHLTQGLGQNGHGGPFTPSLKSTTGDMLHPYQHVYCMYHGAS